MLKINKFISIEAQILLKKIKANPELFATDSASQWTDLIYFGAFPIHERIVIDWTVRKLKIEETKRKIYSLLVD